MNKYILSLAVFTGCLNCYFSYGQQYRVLKITPGSEIMIGTRCLHQYEVFDADSIICWSDAAQAMKVHNINSPSNWFSISRIQFREISKTDISYNSYLRMLGTRSDDNLLIAWADENINVSCNLDENEEYLIHFNNETEMYPVSHSKNAIIINKKILSTHIGIFSVDIVQKRLNWKVKSFRLQVVQ